MKRVWRAPSAADATRPDPADVFAAGERNHHISNTAYPIAHETTWAPYRVPREQHEAVVQRACDDVDDLCLYVHVPFCETRCSFCEYTVVSGADLDNTAGYRDALLQEIDRVGALVRASSAGTGKPHPVGGIDIGGGTPAFVPADDIRAIVDALRANFECPTSGISIETTPKIAAAEPAKLKAYVDVGIERISMGVQVIQPDLLKVLARDGNGVEHHRHAVDHIRAAGFRRLNLDVMYGFADQSAESLAATLKHCIALDPEYVTLYRMRYKLTRISHQAPRVTLAHAKAHAVLARALLEEAGYRASPGKNTFTHQRVNPDKIVDVGTSAYLTKRVIEGTPYLGLGLGAQTFTHTTISYNDGSVGKNLSPYLRSVNAGRLPIQDLYDLPLTQMMAKFVAVAFYFGEIDRVAFAQKFGVDVDDAFAAEVAFVKARGFMHETQGQFGNSRALSLTPAGAAHFAGVIALFFAPSVQRYLLARDPDQATDMDVSRRKALRIAS
ncbi:MAG: radical SAM protein [Deltaproteobacteria bacterium]|nr:radical SAM protein [Deltaproteobacteria bacterium]